MKPIEIDSIDRRILMELQHDCRQSVAELAEKAGLSPSACHRRIKLLDQAGVIEGYAARLSREKLSLTIEFFVEISLQTQSEDALERFEKAVALVPEILECHLMGGQFDYLLRVAAVDAQDYERIHRTRIARLPGLARIQSSLALRTVKGWRGYPV